LRKPIELSSEAYAEICSLLEIDPTQDIEATKYLSSKINWFRTRITIKALKKRFTNKIAFIFGAGPSLTKTINKLTPLLQKYREKIIIIAADGALLALQENDIPIDVVITDLDGNLEAIKKSLLQNTIIVMHAHGDNLTKLKEIEKLIPKIGVIGSTQIKPIFKVSNFGGFTDGDRAVYLAANFNVQTIILHAFDFGSVVGRYSKPDDHTKDFQAPKRKLQKFAIAKKLLQQIPKIFPEINCYNATLQGEEIENWRSQSINTLEKFLEM